MHSLGGEAVRADGGINDASSWACCRNDIRNVCQTSWADVDKCCGVDSSGKASRACVIMINDWWWGGDRGDNRYSDHGWRICWSYRCDCNGGCVNININISTSIGDSDLGGDSRECCREDGNESEGLHPDRVFWKRLTEVQMSDYG